METPLKWVTGAGGSVGTSSVSGTSLVCFSDPETPQEDYLRPLFHRFARAYVDMEDKENIEPSHWPSQPLPGPRDGTSGSGNHQPHDGPPTTRKSKSPLPENFPRAALQDITAVLYPPNKVRSQEPKTGKIKKAAKQVPAARKSPYSKSSSAKPLLTSEAAPPPAAAAAAVAAVVGKQEHACRLEFRSPRKHLAQLRSASSLLSFR
eukprot:jgi/Mesen1/8242/ME000443S07393